MELSVGVVFLRAGLLFMLCDSAASNLWPVVALRCELGCCAHICMGSALSTRAAHTDVGTATKLTPQRNDRPEIG